MNKIRLIIIIFTIVLVILLILIFYPGKCRENWHRIGCEQDQFAYFKAVTQNNTKFCNEIHNITKKDICIDHVNRDIQLPDSQKDVDIFNCEQYGRACV